MQDDKEKYKLRDRACIQVRAKIWCRRCNKPTYVTILGYGMRDVKKTAWERYYNSFCDTCEYGIRIRNYTATKVLQLSHRAKEHPFSLPLMVIK